MADMKNNSGFGLLSEYGLDLGEESDVRSQLRQQRLSDSMKFVTPSRDPRQASFGMLGAALGNALSEKYGGAPAIPPEIEARMKTTEEVKRNFENWRKQNPEATADEITDKYQEEIATSAMRNGLSDIGIQALTQLDGRRKAREKQALELEKLGMDNQFNRETFQARKTKELIEAGKAGVVQIYPIGTDNPNTGVAGVYNPADGSVTFTDANGKPQKVYGGEYTLDRPQWDPRRYNQGGGGGGGSEFLKSEERDLRRDVASLNSLNDSYTAVFDLLDEAEKMGAGPVQGRFGKLLSATNSWLGFAEQLATATNPIKGTMPTSTMTNSDGTTMDFTSSSGRKAWTDRNRHWLRKNLPNLPEKAELADQYIALMTELAYAKALTLEGGSVRSLSDNDFKQSMKSIGMHLNDPRALASILTADADRAYGRLHNKLITYSPEARSRIVNEEAYTKLAEGRARIKAYQDGTAWSVKRKGEGTKTLPKGTGKTTVVWEDESP